MHLMSSLSCWPSVTKTMVALVELSFFNSGKRSVLMTVTVFNYNQKLNKFA